MTASMTAVAFLLIFAAPLVHGFVGPKQHNSLKTPSTKSTIRSLPPTTSSSCTRLFESKPGRINDKIQLDSPKVATTDTPSPGEKAVYCRCWKSGTFPYCDGAHVAHNKSTGDNVGPLIVTAEKTKNDVDRTAAVSEETKAVENEGANEKIAEEIIEVAKVSEEKKLTFMDKVKKVLGLKNDDPDGPTTREKLAKMGLSALLSYGWVSNMSYAVTLSLSWYGFSKKTGLSPLAPGQWKPFLAVYAGFYVFNNIIRPLRFGASVIVSKYFDNFVSFIQNKTKLSRKWSIAIVVIIANVFGTFAAMGLGVSLASAAAGVPIFPPKA
mmetsp:Transcript_9049/g.19107  ORF Transcript_9049/g.19107 Transcript_9049/m.19107 type:complete len:324 (-) Transcript_9049:286-1257(-)